MYVLYCCLLLLLLFFEGGGGGGWNLMFRVGNFSIVQLWMAYGASVFTGSESVTLDGLRSLIFFLCCNQFSSILSIHHHRLQGTTLTLFTYHTLTISRNYVLQRV